MTDFLMKYVVTWVSLCLLGLILAAKDLRLDWVKEWAFLTVPWKLALFLPAIVFVTFAGRYTNDETWDVVSGAGMSWLTFLTSGWAIGTFYKVATGQRPFSHFVISLVVMFFSSSWFYDGYLLWRDGAYTHRWLGNLQLSPIIYVAAGVLLNLEVRDRGLGFGFTRADWPQPHHTTASVWLALAAVPLVAIAAWVLVAYVQWSIHPQK